MTIDLGMDGWNRSSRGNFWWRSYTQLKSRDRDDAPDMNMSYSNMESELGPALRHKVPWTKWEVWSYFEISGYCVRRYDLTLRLCCLDMGLGIQYGCWSRGWTLLHTNCRILGYGSECKFVDMGAGIWTIKYICRHINYIFWYVKSIELELIKLYSKWTPIVYS